MYPFVCWVLSAVWECLCFTIFTMWQAKEYFCAIVNFTVIQHVLGGGLCMHHASSLSFLGDVALKFLYKNCDFQGYHYGSSPPNVWVAYSKVYVRRQHIVHTNSTSHWGWGLSVLSWHPLSCVKLKLLCLKSFMNKVSFWVTLSFL